MNANKLLAVANQSKTHHVVHVRLYKSWVLEYYDNPIRANMEFLNLILDEQQFYSKALSSCVFYRDAKGLFTNVQACKFVDIYFVYEV